MSASNVDQIESAANITLTVSKGSEQRGTGTGEAEAQTLRVPISQLDRTKEIEISEIRESSLKANGYSVTSISFSGSMTFMGEQVHGPDIAPTKIEDILFDDEGVPKPCSITISHELSGNSETYEDVLVTSDSYEVQSESETETAFDWIAMDKS